MQDHPDWKIGHPGKNISHGRNQYVLDFSRPEVVENIFKQMDVILASKSIDYVKWDMNRYISEAYSQSLTATKQGEVMHRYILGVYALYEKILAKYPELLIESCAGGGGRFDPGLLYYAPQTWTSDDTDAVERLKIQYGTSMVYPLSSIGSHVSAVPNHQVARMTSLKMRGDVADFGTFGYELDSTKLSEVEKEIVREQVAQVKRWQPLISRAISTDWKAHSKAIRLPGWSLLPTNRKRWLASTMCWRGRTRPMSGFRWKDWMRMACTKSMGESWRGMGMI